MRVARMVARWSAVVAWTALLGLLAWAHDPAVAERASGYWRSLAELSLLGAAELLVLTAILRPWSYRWAWGRALIASVLLVPWWIFIGGLSLHAGRAAAIHFNWLTLVVVACLLTGVVSLAGALLGNRGGHTPPPVLPG